MEVHGVTRRKPRRLGGPDDLGVVRAVGAEELGFIEPIGSEDRAAS